MKAPRFLSVRCLSPAGFHRMAYYEWGDPANPRVLVCVHGLTRTGRDFDFLGAALASEYRVVCPDVVGRGRSDWLRDPAHYSLSQYAQDMTVLLARLDVEEVDWLGTSMGGLIGMTLAAQPGAPIRRLILNDVGPLLPASALRRIGEYVGAAASFATLAEAENHLRRVSAPFGPLSEAQWHHLTLHAIRRDDDGRYRFCYDPAIAIPYHAMIDNPEGAKDIDLWPLYEAIRCPTLVIRGEKSDLLSRETVAAMRQRGPCAASVEIPDVGHAPMLMDEAQIAIVRDWLRQPC